MRITRSLRNRALKLRLKAYDLKQYARDVRLFSFGGGPSQNVEISPALDRAAKIAVIAIRPTDESQFSTLNLINALHENGYSVLIGADGGVKVEFKSRLAHVSVHYLVRHPIGRDFGVYKDACLTLSEMGLLDTCDYLLLANDSMFYSKSTGNLIHEAEESCKKWACLFENYRDGYHAQSFFLLFERSAILHPSFREFWTSYRPYSARMHAVKKGEIALSSTLVDAIGYPNCVFSSLKLRERLCRLDTRDLIDLFLLLSPIGSYSELIEMNAFEPLKRWNAAFGAMRLDIGKGVEEAAYRSIIIGTLCRLAESSNPTHSLGLIFNRLFAAPVKRDLGWRGISTLADIVGQVQGFGPEELSMIAADLRQRGLPASLQGFSRHLYKKGRI